MSIQFEIVSTMIEFFAFTMLVLVSGILLFALLVLLDEAVNYYRRQSPTRERRRRAAIPLIKIA